MRSVEHSPAPSLSIPAARMPQSLALALPLLMVVCAAASGFFAPGARMGIVEGMLRGALLALFLWSLVAFPWVLRKAFHGVRIVALPDRIVVVPRFGLKRRIPLAHATWVAFSRGVIRHRRDSCEEWRVDLLTGASEEGLRPLLYDADAPSNDAIRSRVGEWSLLGAPAARCAAEWIARRLHVKMIDLTDPTPVQIDPAALDLSYRERVRRMPALAIPASSPPADFEVGDDGLARSAAWRAPDAVVFWIGLGWSCLAGIGWYLALRDAAAAGAPLDLPAIGGLVFTILGIALMIVPQGLRWRLEFAGESLSRVQSLFGVPCSRASVPIARIEDVTWQVPHDSGTLPPARRVVVVTDHVWLWVFVRDEASARWLVGWLQEGLLATQSPTGR